MATALIHFTVKVIVLTVKTFFYAGYGAVTILRALFKLPGQVRQTRRLLGDSISCPWCDTPNSLVGRWSCADCRAQWLGAVLSPCPVCHATAQFFPCSRCAGAIVIGGGL